MNPPPLLGLRHIALFTYHLDACVDFYVNKLKMKIVWQPDADNIYLSTGSDNLALHRSKEDFQQATQQRLDHLGFFIGNKEEVDQWYQYLLTQQVTIFAPPKDHRDGARSFYCRDPEGTVVQMIWLPGMSAAS